MRRYVRQRKFEMGLAKHELFVPQSYGWGQEAQVDWFEADAKLSGEPVKLQVFAMRSMASGDAFHRTQKCAIGFVTCYVERKPLHTNRLSGNHLS